MIQLSKARLRTLLKIHNRNRTRRGEMSARSARKQPTRGVSPFVPDAASAHCKASVTHVLPRTWSRSSTDHLSGTFDLRDTARAMSQEAVERIRRGYEEFNRGDLAAAAEGFDPD